MPVSDWAGLQVECMHEQGFTGTAIREGAIDSGRIPAEQAEAHAMATFVCEARYPMDLSRLQPMNENQINLVYDWILAETVPCVESRGAIAGTPPSREAFADQWFATRTFWIPGGDNTDPSVCPWLPPEDELWAVR